MASEGALEGRVLIPHNVFIQERDKDKNDLLHVEQARLVLGASLLSTLASCGWLVIFSCSTAHLLPKLNMEIN